MRSGFFTSVKEGKRRVGPPNTVYNKLMTKVKAMQPLGERFPKWGTPGLSFDDPG